MSKISVLFSGVVLFFCFNSYAQNIKAEYYYNLPASTLDEALSSGRLNTAPDKTTFPGYFEHNSITLVSNTLLRFSGWISIKTAASYQYEISGAKHSRLKIATNSSGQNLLSPIPEASNTPHRNFTLNSGQKGTASMDVALYYIEVLAFQDNGLLQFSMRRKRLPDGFYEGTLSSASFVPEPANQPPAPTPTPDPLAQTYNVALSWDKNPEPDLSLYKIHYGSSTRNYSSTLNAGLGTSLSQTRTSHVLALPMGTYYFAVTACDFSGNCSGYSNEAFKTLPTLSSPVSVVAEEIQFTSIPTALAQPKMPDRLSRKSENPVELQYRRNAFAVMLEDFEPKSLRETGWQKAEKRTVVWEQDDPVRVTSETLLDVFAPNTIFYPLPNRKLTQEEILNAQIGKVFWNKTVYLPTSESRFDFVAGEYAISASTILWYHRIKVQNNGTREFTPEMIILLSPEKKIIGVRQNSNWIWQEVTPEWEVILTQNGVAFSK